MNVSDKYITSEKMDQDKKHEIIDYSQKSTLSKSELKKLEKQEKKEMKRRIKEEKRESKQLQKSELSDIFSTQLQQQQQSRIENNQAQSNGTQQYEHNNNNNQHQQQIQEQKNEIKNEKLENRWVVNSQTQINFDEDWEDELKEELENKWKEIDSNEGPIMLTTIKQTISKFWNRPLERLPLHSDLPRLVHGLEIVDETSGTMLFKEDGSFDNIARVREMLRTLVREIQGESEANEVISVLNSFKNNDNDIIVQLDRFFKNGCKKYEEAGAPWIKIIKCIHQGIIFPVVFHMKKLFTEKYQYKDVKGSWKVRVSIFKNAVEIEHRKSEKSYGTDADSNFSFQWSLTLRIDNGFKNLDSHVSILNFILDKEMKKSIQYELRSIMQPFLHGAAQYITIWRKPMKKLFVHRDFPRLCQRVSIFKSNGKEVYTRKANETADVTLKNVLLHLCKLVSPELHPSLEYFLERYIKPQGDMSEQLGKILLEEKIIPDDSKLAAILKCINTVIVFPTVDLLHQNVYEKIRYKDIRGTWRVHITIGPNVRGRGLTTPVFEKVSDDLFIEPVSLIESSRNENIAIPEASESNVQYRYVNIIHRKCEQSYSTDPKEYFTFEWMVSITLNRELSTIKDVQFGIIDFTFGPHTSDETKASVLQHIKPFLRPPMLIDAGVSLDAKDLLNAAIKKIEELEKENKLINVYHKYLPHSLPLSALLRSLNMNMPDSVNVRIQKTHR